MPPRGTLVQRGEVPAQHSLVAFANLKSDVVASSCERVLSPHMLRVLCLLFVLSNAIAFAPTPARLARPHLAPTPQTARIRPRIEGTRMRVEGGHACGLRQRLQLAMIVVVSPMICYPAVAVASPVASEQRREAVIGIIEVAAPLAVAVGLCVPTTEPPGPSQSSARSSRRQSPGEALQQWIGRYCTWKALKSGDTWKNTFGAVGATRYDTYLSTYRSSIDLYRSSRLRSTRSSRSGSGDTSQTPAQKYGFFFFLVPGQVSKDSLSVMKRASLRKRGSGDTWQAFKSGDTWRNTFGEVGATRYDTYLSTYRSTRQSTSKPTTRSSNRKSKSSSSGSNSNWFSSYDSGYSYYDGGSFGGGSFDSGGGFSDGGGGFSDGGGGGGADF